MPDLIKRTLKFSTIPDMAQFSRTLGTGYLMNTNNFTLTGRFSDTEIEKATRNFQAHVIATTERVYSYQS